MDGVGDVRDATGRQPTPHAGVMLFEVAGDAISRVRFYLEPVDESEIGIDAAVRQTVGS